jgi:UDP-N-acetylmuramoyl-L-alanyl-D-glutamate--2,6-diaminopimelate ligase
MKLAELVASIPNLAATRGVLGGVEVRAPVVEDSRAVQPGGVFVARRGGQVDGHAYIEAAVEGGAVAIVGERPAGEIAIRVPYIQVENGGLALAWLSAAYAGFPSRRLVMIGVTGTDGKTTTTSLIHSILSVAGLRVGMISTINALLGDEELPTGLHVTTPPAPQVQGYLARMVEAGLTHCVLEATSHGLAQHRVSACDFDAAVVTNIQHEHLDFHGSWEEYRAAKAMLFRHLMSGVRKSGVPKLAVINQDDTPSADYLAAIPVDKRLRYAIDAEEAEVRATEIDYRPDATSITIRLPDGSRLPVESALVGAFNVSNILAAVALGYGLDIPVEAIKSGVEAVRHISGRMERIDEGQPFLALVDFAHTPNALRRALETARMMIQPGGRVIVVFGSAGLRDPEKRAMMGRIAGELADRVVITAEDPRTESLEAIMATSAAACAERGGVEGETFWQVPDRGEAIHHAVRFAEPGDVVIVCGKGHEQSMCFGTVEYPWDDRKATRAALRGAPLRTLPTAQGD